jgi:hypothetical protein
MPDPSQPPHTSQVLNPHHDPPAAPQAVPAVLPTIGRIVHYVLKQGPSAGQSRAAIVTNAFGGDACNGTVFVDRANDGALHPGDPPSAGAEEWFSSARYDGGTPTSFPGEHVRYQPGTWHWPPRQANGGQGGGQTFVIAQDLRDQDPDRVAKAFEEVLGKMLDRHAGSRSFGT